MLNGQNIVLPIDMMHETADRLGLTGSDLQSQISAAIRLADSSACRLPAAQRDREQMLEQRFNARLQELLTARTSIARILRSAAGSAVTLDASARQALDQNL